MPNAAGQTTFEDVAKLLQSKPNPMDLPQYMSTFEAGFTDLASRLGNLEHMATKAAWQSRVAETKAADLETRLSTAEKDRDAYAKRIEAIEKAPAENTKRADDIEKRVSTVEGAVGSAGYKEDSTKPKVEWGKPAVQPTEAGKPQV